MEKIKVSAIFDIGKTNKKYYLFNTQGEIVHQSSIQFEELLDRDDFPSDDLKGIEDWMKLQLDETFSNDLYEVDTINFSAYGASLVHLDKEGNRLPFFVNYLKPIPDHIIDQFFMEYGPVEKFCEETSSPFLAMLNSGLQLYWLKYDHPEIFKEIVQVLHFPQYLSYVVCGEAQSEYTSIGCHTGLWDFKKQDYHHWVYAEGLDQLFPPIVHSNTYAEIEWKGKSVLVGRGLHDSSAALLPYLKSETSPFLLLSTGTWSICINPFSTDHLSSFDLEHDCLNLLRIDGGQVRVARLFLGKEYEELEAKLCNKYSLEKSLLQKLKWNPKIFRLLSVLTPPSVSLKYLKDTGNMVAAQSTTHVTLNWELEYYQMMDKLIDLQVNAIVLAKGRSEVSKLIIDGGFVSNEIFVKMLQFKLPNFEIQVSNLPSGSARGVYDMDIHR